MIYYWKKIIVLLWVCVCGMHLAGNAASTEERTEFQSAPVQSSPLAALPNEVKDGQSSMAPSTPLQSSLQQDIVTSDSSQSSDSKPIVSKSTPSIEKRLEKMQTLKSLLAFIQEEYDIRLATFKTLQSGQDEEAKRRSVDSLRELRLLSLNRCCLLTGLTPEWGTEGLRVKKSFFDQIIDQYSHFNAGLLEYLNKETEQGGITAQNACILAKYLAYGGQRVKFFAKTVSFAHEDEKTFSRAGTGGALDSWTYGVARRLGVSETTGYYYVPKNHHLALFGVQREDQEVAAKLVTLFTKFHDPLGIKETIDYGPYKNKELDAIQVEGELPFHLLGILQEMKEFWRGELISISSLGQSSSAK